MKGGIEPPRVVFDTNVLISALGFKGRVARLWSLVEEGRIMLLTSLFILQELERNLFRKLVLPPASARAILDEVERRAEIVHPVLMISAIKAKESDNRILECAVAGRASYIVTGNMAHIRPLGDFQGIAILTPAEFLTEFAEGSATF